MAEEAVVQTTDATTDQTTTQEPSVVHTETTPPADQKPAEPTSPSDEPKQTRFQRRIDQMTRKIHELERQLATQPRQADSTPVIPEREPQESEFAEYSQYLKALTKWEIRQAQMEARMEATTRQEQARAQELARNFEPQLQVARVKYEDFDEVVSQPIFTPMTQELLQQSDHGADIAYFLGTNLQEATRLSQLPPMTLAREIVKLESRFTMQPKTVSNAPAPITPVSGAAPALKDPDKMTTDEWMAWERQQRLERLKARPF